MIHTGSAPQAQSGTQPSDPVREAAIEHREHKGPARVDPERSRDLTLGEPQKDA